MCWDYFSGEARIWQTWRSAGERALKFDCEEDDLHQNMLKPQGFVTSIVFALRLAAWGTGHLATCCKTWVYTSRGSTLRHELNVLGDLSKECVVEGNDLVSKMTLVLFLIQTHMLNHFLCTKFVQILRTAICDIRFHLPLLL